MYQHRTMRELNEENDGRKIEREGKGKREEGIRLGLLHMYKYNYHIRVQRSGLRVFGLSYNNARWANPTDGLSCRPRPGVVCAQRRASSSSKSVPGSCGWSNSPRKGDSVATPMNIDLRGVTGVKGANCDEVRRREGVRSRFSVSSDVVVLWP